MVTGLAHERIDSAQFFIYSPRPGLKSFQYLGKPRPARCGYVDN